ncbi:MAG: transposase [Parcubacteria group bacterium]|nr:transposase [Parcubacteria group bacterium]
MANKQTGRDTVVQEEEELDMDRIANALGAERRGREETVDLADWVDIIPPHEFDAAFDLFYRFFKKEGFIQVPVQHLMRPPLARLAACENPDSIVAVEFLGEKYPLPQTGQMWGEDFLLRNPDAIKKGLFWVSTSYRAEQTPQKGRHNIIFPMFEFEMHGSYEALRALERRFIAFLGIATEEEIYQTDYCKTAARYGVREIEDAEEKRLWQEHGPAVQLDHFPDSSSPFFNMMRILIDLIVVAKKTDCILYGVETIGSAERSKDPQEMWRYFHTISGGKYAAKLFELFGEKEILAELNYFLDGKNYPRGHITRSGGGIGVNRLIRALKLAGKLKL